MADTNGKGRILVIDDESEIREGLELLLTSEGYSVDLAHNGPDGERRLGPKLYDLVLLDLMMPDKSGMDVLRDLRATRYRNAGLHDHRLRQRGRRGSGAEDWARTIISRSPGTTKNCWSKSSA